MSPPPGATPTGPPVAAAPRGSARVSAQLSAAGLVLQARSRAVHDRDKAAWMATVADPTSSFGVRQSLVFDNLMRLPVEGFTYDVPTPGPALTAPRARALGPRAFVGQSQGHYSLAGFDRSPRTFTTAFTFVPGAGGWRIAADGDGVTTSQVWDLPGMRVVHGRTSIVVGNDAPARMRSYRDDADAGVARVSAVWGRRWSSHVVLVTPATVAQFAALLGRTGDTGLDQVAAITIGSTLAGTSAGGDRVVVNPDTFADLQPAGRQVVVTHELTHVAVRSSTTRATPLWLSEGLADYVGYLGLDLPRTRVAAPLLARVRAGTAPRRLPTDADFDPAHARIAPAYAAAWLACSRLADRYGQARLVAFYRAVAGATSGVTSPAATTPSATTPATAATSGASPAAPSPTAASSASVAPATGAAADSPDAATAGAFVSVLGTTQQAFVSSWLSYVARLARS